MMLTRRAWLPRPSLQASVGAAPMYTARSAGVVGGGGGGGGAWWDIAAFTADGGTADPDDVGPGVFRV